VGVTVCAVWPGAFVVVELEGLAELAVQPAAQAIARMATAPSTLTERSVRPSRFVARWCEETSTE
jgi:hypothetical protein